MHLPSSQRKAVISTNGESTSACNRATNVVSLPWILRFTYFVLGVGLIGLLVSSRTLSPDPSGIGTHKQLGLPPCGFMLISGVPCPSCGMTTSWALATRGQLIASAQCNIGGCLMALLALPAGVWLLATAYRGHWVFREPRPLVVSAVFAVVIAATLIQWAMRIQLL